MSVSRTPKKIMVIGSSGQLGKNMCQVLTSEYAIQAVSRSDLDLTELERIRSMILESNPDVLINAAAYTQVDAAEDHQDLALRINAAAPEVMAIVARELDIPLIQFSTDYVFDGAGTKPYVEADLTRPVNLYGESKRRCEELVLAANPNSIVIRTSWVYSSVGKNFYLTMLRLAKDGKAIKVVDDQIGTPTTTEAITAAVQKILQRIGNTSVQNHGGIYHFTCAGETSWFGFAKEIFSQKKLAVDLSPLATADYPTRAKRPKYSVLDCSKIRSEFGVVTPDWKNALKDVIQSH